MSKPSFRVTHRGYTMTFDQTGYGSIDGIADLVTAEAEPGNMIREARAAIDDYLESCAELGVEPNIPRSSL